MNITARALFSLIAIASMFLIVGSLQSWSVALGILNLCLVSALMSLGVNIQWGYAGLLNFGVMGFAALGGLAGVLVAMPPVLQAWESGGSGLLFALFIGILTIVSATLCFTKLPIARSYRLTVAILVTVAGFMLYRAVFDPAVRVIESVDAARSGYLGGLGLPILLAWVMGGVFAAGAAWLVAKIALGLRADYLAIATLGISEIIVAVLKNEDWLSRGVKNVTGLPRPVPYEIDLQQSAWFQELAINLDIAAVELSSLFVKLCYAGLLVSVLMIVLLLSQRALQSPWGRMMRAIRDNEVAAEAMGKDVTRRHLQVFVLGSAVVGIAGAMLTTLDGQFTPASYQPLRFTFLIWVMVIVGGSGNNWGAIVGGFVVWFFWIEAEPLGRWLMNSISSGMPVDSPLRLHLLESAAYMRPITLGLILLLVLRFSPKGLLPGR